MEQLRSCTVGDDDSFSLIITRHRTQILLCTPSFQFFIESTHHEVVAYLSFAPSAAPVLEDLILLSQLKGLSVRCPLKLNDCNNTFSECLDEPSPVAGATVHGLGPLSLDGSSHFHFSVLHHEGHTTLRTDHHHLTCIKVLHASSVEGLPLGTAVQFNRVAQLVHREYVLMKVEKDLQLALIFLVRVYDMNF